MKTKIWFISGKWGINALNHSRILLIIVLFITTVFLASSIFATQASAQISGLNRGPMTSQNNPNEVSSNILYLENLNSQIPKPKSSFYFIGQITQFLVTLFGSLPTISTLVTNPINNSCENDIDGLATISIKVMQYGGLTENDTKKSLTLQQYFHVDCKDVPAGIQDEWIHEAYAKQRGFPMLAQECNDTSSMINAINLNAVSGGNGYYTYTPKQSAQVSELAYESLICSSMQSLRTNYNP